MEDRFTDHMEMRKDWRKMRQLRYKGDIQEYLSKHRRMSLQNATV